MSSPSLRPLIDICQKCSTSPANHEPRSPANGSFQNPGVCPQAVPSFLPLPYPHRSVFGSRPIFRAGKIPKTPFLGLSLLPNPTETLATQARLNLAATGQLIFERCKQSIYLSQDDFLILASSLGLMSNKCSFHD